MKFFRLLSWLEALSAAALFFFAMPAKYFFNAPQWIFPIGMLHGILFLLFFLALLLFAHWRGWSVGVFLAGLLAAIVPLGTLLFDAYLQKREAQA